MRDVTIYTKRDLDQIVETKVRKEVQYLRDEIQRLKIKVLDIEEIIKKELAGEKLNGN
jgi:hypothetical protein